MRRVMVWFYDSGVYIHGRLSDIYYLTAQWLLNGQVEMLHLFGEAEYFIC